MNKRQKKKNINRALERIGTQNFTGHDKHILKTYGRESFRAEYKLEPEVLDIDPAVVTETLGHALFMVKRSIKSLFRSIGEAFTRMGE